MSSEYEDNYENALMRHQLMNKIQNATAQQQMEAQIQNQMNIEQQNALTQLQYYDLLHKIQQHN